MKNITIYYSSFNIDSVLAALLMREEFKKDNNVVELVNYNRSIEFTFSTIANEVHIVGPVFHSIHLETLLYKNPGCSITLYNVDNVLSYKSNILTKIIVIESPIHEEDNSKVFKDLTTLIIDIFDLDIPLNVSTDSKMYKDSIESILKYKQLKVMSDIKELADVQCSLNVIKECLEDDKPFNMASLVNNFDKEKNKLAYNKHIAKIRALINRNFSVQILNSGSSTLHAPVINITEEYAIAVLRLISYSYDDVVTYEDTAQYRFYRVYSVKNKEWLIKCIKPIDHWIEGEVMILKVEKPAHRPE